MSGDWDNPPNAILTAATSVIGWAVAVPCLVYLGLLLGCTTQNEPMSLAFAYLLFLPLLWIVHPMIFPAYLVIVWADWWPLRSESNHAFTTAGLVTIASWALGGWAMNDRASAKIALRESRRDFSD